MVFVQIKIPCLSGHLLLKTRAIDCVILIFRYTLLRDLEMVAVGALQETIFFSNDLLLSLSSTGFGVVWRLHEDNAPEPRKLLRLQGATCLHKWDNYLVVGFSDSMIRM